MKYIIPTVPSITITNKNKETFTIKYILEFNTVTLQDNSTLIVLEAPLSDTDLDNLLNYLDIYTLQCEFESKDIMCKSLGKKLRVIKNMRLVRKYERYTSELKAEENVYIFYNGSKNIDKTIETILLDKKKEQLKQEIKQELLRELIN